MLKIVLQRTDGRNKRKKKRKLDSKRKIKY